MGISLLTFGGGQTAFSPPPLTERKKLIAENGQIQLPVSDMGLNVIQKGLPRDLAVVVQTALMKEPGRRYGSVEQLSGDLWRHLAGMPVLAICRGFQEMNVAFGGTLHQMVHEQPGYGMHKENEDDPLDVQYGPAHEVRFAAGGMLERITCERGATVNSLHSQGVDRLGEGLEVEAVAGDGLVEGFTVREAPGFTLALQWHPEWKAADN